MASAAHYRASLFPGKPPWYGPLTHPADLGRNHLVEVLRLPDEHNGRSGVDGDACPRGSTGRESLGAALYVLVVCVGPA